MSFASRALIALGLRIKPTSAEVREATQRSESVQRIHSEATRKVIEASRRQAESANQVVQAAERSSEVSRSTRELVDTVVACFDKPKPDDELVSLERRFLRMER